MTTITQKLSDIFVKDVARPIDGVIRAADNSNLGIEVEEYVLTNEIEKNLTRLLEAYTNYENANGVWVSGFFGSGKSHMLKMLAHLLGDVRGVDFDRAQVVESFIAKSGDSFLAGLLEKSADMPATNLLFNIAEEVAEKDRADAVLRVFAKIFNESRGYTGKLPFVARFERDLDRNGEFGQFKEAFQRITGHRWEDKRAEGARQENNVALALAEASGSDMPDNLLAKYREDYQLSVDDFTDEVLDWLNAQEDPKHRLGFYVDEVGLFIGNDTGLMLELQTLAESLNTKCQGRAWVFVTSQEDMEKVVGDRSKQQGSDFTRIQARFRTRVKLTSADVEEVIRKRLLEKTDDATAELQLLFALEKANFKTLFDFPDGSKTYRNYVDEGAFVGTYPFVSYQFTLFHTAMEGMSDHNIFEGRHQAVGERSMLATVQHVAKGFADQSVGSIATFDRFYEGIETDFKGAAKSQIEVATRNLDDRFAVRVLKTLFLVKFVEGFNATVRNLTVLLYGEFGLDILGLQAEVKAALDLLEAETYVQRTGDAYEYLTNDEHVIEEEIKGVDLDSSELSARLHGLLSADVLKASKFRYVKTGQDFPFGWMLDNQAYGAQKALTVHAISPAFPYDIETARLQSAGRDEVRVVLAADERLMPDLALVLKTEKYVRLKNSPSLTENERRIIESKVRLNTARKKEVIERLRKAIGTGTLIVNAEDVPSPSTDAISHVEDGLAALVGKVFPNLNLLGGITYTETDIAKYAKSDEGMIGTESLSKLTPVTNEVLSRVEMLRNQGELVTVKRLVDVFESKPFGWPFAATLVAMAQLLASSALSASLDGTVVRKPDCAAVLRNTAKQSQTVLSVPEVFDPNKVQSLKAFCIEFFDDGAVPADPLDLAKHLADKLRDKRDSLAFLVKGSQYPFMTQLARPVALLDAACGKALDWYFKDFNSHIDELLETKQNLIVPISAFVNDGGQKAIYDEARAVLVSHKNNISYLSEGSDADVRKGLEDPNIFRGMRMPQLKKAVYTLNSLLTEEIAARKAGAAEVIDDRRAQLRASADYGRADERQREGVDRRIQSVIDAIDGQDQIAQVIQIRTSFEEKVYPALLDTLQPIPPGPEPKQKVTVMIGAINVSTGLKVLDSVVDVDRYLDDLRCVLLSTIEDNKRIAF